MSGRVGRHVRQEARLGDVAGRHGRLGRHGRADLDVLLDLRLDGAHERLDLDVRRRLLGELLDPRADERLGLREPVEAHPGLALDDRAHGAVLELDDLGDLGHGADRVQLGRVGDVLLVRLALGDQRDAPTLRHGGVEGGDALVPAHLERDDHLGEDHRLPKRDERQLGDRDGALVVRVGRSLRHRFSYGFLVTPWGPTRPPRRPMSAAAGGVLGGRPRSGASLGRAFAVQALEDPGAQALLELEEDPHAGEVDAEVLGQVADPHDPPDVVLGVQADVGRRSRRADQPLLLVDPQGSRMHADDARRHADHVDGSLGVSIRPAERHLSSAVLPSGLELGGLVAGSLAMALAHWRDLDLAGLDLLGLRDLQAQDAVLERGRGLAPARGRSAASPSG